MIFQWHVRGGEASDDLFLYNCNGIILQNLVNVDLFWSIGFTRIGIVLSKMIFQVWKNPLCIKCFLNHCWRWPKYKIQNILVIIFCKKQLYIDHPYSGRSLPRLSLWAIAAKLVNLIWIQHSMMRRSWGYPMSLYIVCPN